MNVGHARSRMAWCEAQLRSAHIHKVQSVPRVALDGAHATAARQRQAQRARQEPLQGPHQYAAVVSQGA